MDRGRPGNERGIILKIIHAIIHEHRWWDLISKDTIARAIAEDAIGHGKPGNMVHENGVFVTTLKIDIRDIVIIKGVTEIAERVQDRDF